MLTYLEDGQACLFDLVIYAGKMSPEHSPAALRREKTSGLSSRRSSELVSLPYMFLDLSEDAGNLLGESYWETLSPWRGDASMLNTGPAPRSAENVYSLWQILEEQPHSKYYLTRKACQGILRRARERGKELPPQLEDALAIQAGMDKNVISDTEEQLPIGIDSKHACASGDIANTLSTNCGSSTGRNGVMLPVAFTQNQRNEVRDLHEVSAVVCASPGTNQQTFVAAGVVSKGDGTCVLTGTTPTSLSAGGGQAGQGYPCILTKEKPQTLGKEESESTLSTLCLNDQGGHFMSISHDVAATLRAQMHGHPPILLESNQDHATVRTDGVSTTLPASMGMGGGYVPMVYDNHSRDARYNGPLDVAPTMFAAYGTGGNNVPLVEQPMETFCIVGNIIDRQPGNGGNGLGCQKDIAYTLTGMDRHAVYSRQRTDIFKENDVVSTESARQHKDATDLVMQPYQQTVGTIGFTDHKGINNQYVSEDKCVVEGVNLIRRLTPLECERLQGFPDYWTDIPGASDSARYKALGNSVAVPCVDFVMNGIRLAIEAEKAA